VLPRFAKIFGSNLVLMGLAFIAIYGRAVAEQTTLL